MTVATSRRARRSRPGTAWAPSPGGRSRTMPRMKRAPSFSAWSIAIGSSASATDPDRGHRNDRAGAQPVEQPDRLGDDEERGEVVGADGERGDSRPARRGCARSAARARAAGRAASARRAGRAARRRAPPASTRRAAGWRRRAPRPPARRGRTRRARRSRRRPGSSPCPASADSDRRPTSPVPKTLGPEPGDDVVERRGRLAVGDRGQHVAEVHPQQVDGRGLVEPVALDVERREPQRGGQQHDPREHRAMARGHARAA